MSLLSLGLLPDIELSFLFVDETYEAISSNKHIHFVPLSLRLLSFFRILNVLTLTAEDFFNGDQVVG